MFKHLNNITLKCSQDSVYRILLRDERRCKISILFCESAIIFFFAGIVLPGVQGIFTALLFLYFIKRCFSKTIISSISEIKKIPKTKLTIAVYYAHCLSMTLLWICILIKIIGQNGEPQIVNDSFYLVNHGEIMRQITKTVFYVLRAASAGVWLAACELMSTLLLGYDLIHIQDSKKCIKEEQRKNKGA